MAVLAYAVKVRNHTLVNVMMGIAGAGTGVRFMPYNLHLAGMFRDQLAPVFGILRFSMPFGGTLALTIMGAVFQNEMASFFGNAGLQNSGVGLDLHNQAALQAIDKLPKPEQDAVRGRGADATMWAFISILPFLGVSVLAAGGLGNVWIERREKAKESGGSVEEEEEGKREGQEAREQDGGRGGRAQSEVLMGWYLMALFTGTVKPKRRPGPTEAGPVKTSDSSARRLHDKTEQVVPSAA